MTDYVIEVHTADYRGDHSADVVRALRPIEGETVEDLMKRVKAHTHETHDSHVVLREFTKEKQGA